jgi:hypothetical protein
MLVETVAELVAQPLTAKSSAPATAMRLIRPAGPRCIRTPLNKLVPGLWAFMVKKPISAPHSATAFTKS